MKTNSNLIWKLSSIVIVLFVWSAEAEAQFSSIAMKQVKLLSPIVKVVSGTIHGSNTETPSIDLNSEREKSYINSSLFLFQENIQVCKDIITGKNDSLFTKTEEKDTPEQIQVDSSKVMNEPQKVLKKKKSFWNHPGNTKTRI